MDQLNRFPARMGIVIGSPRYPNGFWAGKSGPQHQRVSAVLFVPHLYAHMVASAKPKLWHNPWADHPLAPRLWVVDQMVPNRDTTTLEEQPGRSARELFGLPDDWPGWAEEQGTLTAEL